MVMTRRGGDGGTLPLTFISMFTCGRAKRLKQIMSKEIFNKSSLYVQDVKFFFFHILELTVNVITHLEIPGHKE